MMDDGALPGPSGAEYASTQGRFYSTGRPCAVRRPGAAVDRDNLSDPLNRALTNRPRHRPRPREALSEILSTRCYIRGMSIRSGLRKLKPGASVPIRHLWRAFAVIAPIGAVGIVLWLAVDSRQAKSRRERDSSTL